MRVTSYGDYINRTFSTQRENTISHRIVRSMPRAGNLSVENLTVNR